MDILIKPIINPEYPEDKFCPDWVIYEAGEYGKPLAIIGDYKMRALINVVCGYHKMKVVDAKK